MLNVNFSNMCIWVHKGSLNRLVVISLHPLISNCVEALVIGMQRPGYLPQIGASDEEGFQAQSQSQRVFRIPPELSDIKHRTVFELGLSPGAGSVTKLRSVHDTCDVLPQSERLSYRTVPGGSSNDSKNVG